MTLEPGEDDADVKINERIRKGWRSAAVIAAVVQVAWFAWVISQGSFPSILAIAALVGFINGVRGTYALRRLMGNASSPAVEAV